MSSSKSLRPAALAIAVGLAVWATGCKDNDPTAPMVTEVQFARAAKPSGATTKVKVEATDPSSGQQGRIKLDVRVFGSGFDQGSDVSFELDQVPTEDISTNSTTYVSETELVANVDIAIDATLDLYDVAVITSRKKKGVGIEMFEVTPGIVLVSVDAGGMFSCGLDDGGKAHCWGNNDHGQLGLGGRSSEKRTVPTAVAGGLTFLSISTGWRHSCGIVNDGSGAGPAYCWGDNFFDQLGDGSGRDKREPTPVAGGLKFESISAGMWHTCGIVRGDGAYCWGDGLGGRLGQGSTSDSDVPVAVVGGSRFVKLSAGNSVSCALDLDGAAHCWGSNEEGQLGIGSFGGWSTEPVPVAGGHVFRSLSAWGQHACGLTTSGEVFCWGDNYGGQLGDGTETGRSVPTPLKTDGIGEPTFVFLSALSAIAYDGQAYTWGGNGHGELGIGTFGGVSLEPVPVGSPSSFTSVGVGVEGHACGMASSGKAYCWGWNDWGQLGIGNGFSQALPTLVEGQRF